MSSGATSGKFCCCSGVTHAFASFRGAGTPGSFRLHGLLVAALTAALLTIPSAATAAGRRTPTLAPSNTVIDGPSAGILGLNGLAVARDGSGGLVYLKDVAGVPHVFVSVLSGGRFQAPQQVDQGLVGPSSQPVIVARNGGLLLVAFISSHELYVVQEPATGDAWQAPIGLYAGAANPSLSISTFGKAYLAFTALGAIDTVRTAYYYNGDWALGSAPLNANPGESAGAGSDDAPDVATAGDGTAIVAWGEAGHVFTRRVLGTSPSVVYEQADPPAFGGWSEVSAADPQVSAGGDSSYAAVAFAETLQNGGTQQSRVLVNRLQASQFDGASAADGGGTESADQPRVALQEYGAGFVTSEGESTHNIFATQVANNAAPQGTSQANSAFEQAAPDAVPAVAGTVSTLIAWQQNPGADGPEIRVRYAADGSDLGPEEVVSSPTLGPTNADQGLFAGGDLAGDAAIAFVQGTGAQTQIVAAQLFQAPGGMTPSVLFQYQRTVNPVLSWSPASELWGSPVYTVKVGGVAVGQTTATRFQVPVALAQGRHVWQVTATNLAGLTNVSRTSTVFVDTTAPHVTLKITGTKAVGSVLRATVSYTDAPHHLPHADASGVKTVQIKWGDGKKAFITHTHRATHVYKRRRSYTVTVIVFDRAGNRTVVTRRLKIARAGAHPHSPSRKGKRL